MSGRGSGGSGDGRPSGCPKVIESGRPFDLDRAVDAWSRRLRSSPDLEDGTIAELAEHLRDEVQERIEGGQDPEEAFRDAAAAVESAEAIGSEYRKTDARGWWAPRRGRRAGFSPALILNSVKVTLRKMRREKWYSLISVSGLAVGIACAVLIMLWVRHELSYDRFHAGADRIFRVIMEERRPDGTSIHPWLPFALGPALRAEFPEIAAASRWRPDDFVVRYGEAVHTEQRFLTVDPEFFKVFSFPFREGSPDRALADGRSIVIRDTVARKYFGDADPVGGLLNLSGRADLVVSGVVHIPEESDFQFDFFFSFASYPLFNVDLAPLEANWDAKNYHLYLLLKPGADAAGLEKKISAFLKPHNPGRDETLRLQKLSAIHLFKPDGSDAGMRYVRIFSLVAALVLLIACVNFMNLSTARFEKRAREVGLRKTLGATRAALARHFFSESMFHSVLALAGALVLVWAAMPFFVRVTGRPLTLDLLRADVLFGLAGLTLLAGFVAGLYPALYLSSLGPEQIIRRDDRSGGRSARLRRVLVVTQFSLSTALVIGTLVVSSQLSYILTRDLGMDKEHIVYHLMQKTTRDSVTAVRAELLRHPGIESVASASYLPTETIGWGGLTWEGGEARQEFQAAFLSVDADFVKTLGLTVVEGRNFSAANPADAGRFLVNQAAVRQMGVNHALGLQIQFWHHRGPIVGVVRDFANRHLANATAPMVMSCGPWGVNRNYLFLKLKPGDPRPALRHFQAVWRRVNPGFPAEYQFLDEAYDRMYANERRLSRIILGFTLLAVFISGLGLVGLASFLAEEKTKEIGVRKVVGASSWRIVSLLSMNFARLVLAANVIAWPLGYLVMHQWLENYADHVRIGPLVFILAGAAGLVAALFSVGYQTLRAATANPVESLRHE